MSQFSLHVTVVSTVHHCLTASTLSTQCVVCQCRCKMSWWRLLKTQQVLNCSG